MSFRFPAVSACLLLALNAAVVQGAVLQGPDGDGDGVADEHDACRYSPRGLAVGPDGCSRAGDEDEDGIADAADACPLSPAGAVVGADGCALDADADGVADGIDRCPSTPVGALVSVTGCAPGQVAVATPVRRPAATPVAAPAMPVAVAPAPVAAVLVGVARPGPSATTPSAAAPSVPAAAPAAPARPAQTFDFDPGESRPGWSTRRAIKAAAPALAQELAQNPRAMVMLSGHADTKSDGPTAARLAAARATAVREALIAGGVPAGRIRLRVAGVLEPRFDGADLARNCRVELRVLGRDNAPSVAIAPAAVPALPKPGAAIVPAAPAATVAVAAPAVPPPAPAAPVPPAPIPAALAGSAEAAVSFAPFSASLDEAAAGALRAFVQGNTRSLLADPHAQVVVISGLEALETGAAAVRLAESRAASIASYLHSLGIPRQRIEVSTEAQTGGRRAELRVVAR